MLNRTNRTLSANLNRLNLGTRSLAFVANVNNGAKTLATSHTHRGVMRDGMNGYRSSIPISGDAIPSIPDPRSVSPRPVSGRTVRPRVELAVEMFPATDRTRRGEVFRSCFGQQSWQTPERWQCEGKLHQDKPLHQASDHPAILTRAAFGPNAIFVAALGG
jgi:hypothetical protein